MGLRGSVWGRIGTLSYESDKDAVPSIAGADKQQRCAGCFCQPMMPFQHVEQQAGAGERTRRACSPMTAKMVSRERQTRRGSAPSGVAQTEHRGGGGSGGGVWEAHPQASSRVISSCDSDGDNVASQVVFHGWARAACGCRLLHAPGASCRARLPCAGSTALAKSAAALPPHALIVLGGSRAIHGPVCSAHQTAIVHGSMASSLPVPTPARAPGASLH
ncbi:uncharacterized protein CC84DRAFT_1245464 [Paraphaeosphaeria sporulosa]|uniref:Uncharacterized protein n=1 Tax=Paraphaeosphaeria sporulosa TaxID=1460663 RepID=A0A177CGB3_9PLEO|nr:uncharacterized protein CC84DRAFT_1245464 [Paraphaeosphaeria sporulosa]OAG06261.1 hypothetical protein CC84DRAFT_1245464 [Paraphaeosphaeria sporulosa]